jgi:hypothetical protein
MRDQTARDTRFPTACARCGGRISEPVAFCPHCGAHARFALAGSAPREPRGPAAAARGEPSVRSFESSDFEGDLDGPWLGPPTPLFASPDGDPYADMRAPAFRGTRARQWNLKGGMGLVLAAFVLLYGGAVLLHRYDQASPSPSPVSQDSATKSVEGSIASNGVAGTGGPGVAGPSTSPSAAPRSNAANSANSGNNRSGVQAPAANNPALASRSGNYAEQSSGAPPAPKADDSIPPDMSIANLPPPATASTAPPVASVQAQRTPSNSAPPTASNANEQTQQAQQQAQQAQPNGSAQRAYGKPVPDTRAPMTDTTMANAQLPPQQREEQARATRAAVIARTLDGIQSKLAKNDLKGARASLRGVLTAEPGNGYAKSLLDQLVSREQARDASLNAARACVVQSRWHCVWHNAGAALSIDASSTEAKALVDRAIIESGAAAAPAGPGPDNVQVPMVQ